MTLAAPSPLWGKQEREEALKITFFKSLLSNVGWLF